MRSEVGSLLTKISAILDLVVAVLVLLGAIGVSVGIAIIDWIPDGFILLVILISALYFVFGLLVWRAAEMMKDSRTVRSGAIWAIVLGILTIGTFSGILALVGGIIAIVDSGK